MNCDEEPTIDKLGNSDILPVINNLKQLKNILYEVKYDMQGKLSGLFVQDKQMKTFFNHYPEFMCIDILCEIIELEFNLCLFISEDSNGYCEIISFSLIKTDDIECFSWMCEIFKMFNPEWKRIKIIATDKDTQGWEATTKAFPDVLLLVSFFHSMKALKKDISNLDKTISNYDINGAIQIFESMIYSCDEADYLDLLKQLKHMSTSILTFFKKNWHPKRETWALGLKLNSKSFLKSLNNYLLYIRKKIRPTINTEASFESIVSKIFSFLKTCREKKYKNITSIFKTILHRYYPKQVFYRKYSKYLTCYAAELVFQQLNDTVDIKNLRKLTPGKYSFNDTSISVTISSCTCKFYNLILLPCCHIFSLRKFLSLPLYVETLCSGRWTSNYYQNTFLLLHDIYSSEIKSPAQHKEESERFHKYFEFTSELFPLLTECSDEMSRERINIFQNLLTAWKYGLKVTPKAPENSKYMSNNSMILEDLSTDNWKDLYGITLKDILDSENDFSSVSFGSEHSNEEL